MTLLVSLIIVGISTVTAILIDRFVAKKNIQNDSKIFNQEKTMIDEEYRYSVNENKEIIETTSSSNSNSQIEYYKGVKKSILAFVIYYAFNIGGGLVFQFILHPFVLKDLGITIEQLIETSQYYDEATYKMYESYLTGYLNFVVFAVIFVGLILLYKKSLLQDLKELKAKPFKILKLAGLGFVGMYVANFFVSVIVMLFFGDDFVSTNQNSLIDLFNAGGDIRILLVIFTVIFAPIVEELLFRKSLFNFFKKDSGVAIIVSALIFAGGCTAISTEDSTCEHSHTAVSCRHRASAFHLGLNHIKHLGSNNCRMAVLYIILRNFAFVYFGFFCKEVYCKCFLQQCRTFVFFVFQYAYNR